MLFSILVKFVLYLSLQCEKRTKTNKKRGWVWPIKKYMTEMLQSGAPLKRTLRAVAHATFKVITTMKKDAGGVPIKVHF